MHYSIQNLNNIKNKILDRLNDLEKSESPKIIAVSKTFALDQINPLIESGHFDFGENKVQETLDKWSDIKLKNEDIKLHLIGKLQTNKVKYAVKIFDYIHSVDTEKLAKKIADELIKSQRKIKIFIQVNIGDENQKSGVHINNLEKLYLYCQKINLNVIGLMCIPPAHDEPEKYFKKMNDLKKNLNLKDLSMGMSSDYLKAVEYSSTYLRIGSSIFGERS
jgi:pyridoxal phosphate enzyme (YggS family)